MNDIKSYNHEVLGAKIRKLREEKGYTQEYVAEKIDVTWTYISGIELGVKTPSIKTFLGIARVLDTDPAYLLSNEFNMENVNRIIDNKDRLKNIINNMTEKEVECLLNFLNTFRN